MVVREKRKVRMWIHLHRSGNGGDSGNLKLVSQQNDRLLPIDRGMEDDSMMAGETGQR